MNTLPPRGDPGHTLSKGGPASEPAPHITAPAYTASQHWGQGGGPPGQLEREMDTGAARREATSVPSSVPKRGQEGGSCLQCQPPPERETPLPPCAFLHPQNLPLSLNKIFPWEVQSCLRPLLWWRQVAAAVQQGWPTWQCRGHAATASPRNTGWAQTGLWANHRASAGMGRRGLTASVCMRGSRGIPGAGGKWGDLEEGEA